MGIEVIQHAKELVRCFLTIVSLENKRRQLPATAGPAKAHSPLGVELWFTTDSTLMYILREGTSN